MDVDSTLIQDEVIELLADHAGKRAEVAEVTERAMRGELDFASSLIERVATLKGLPANVLEETLKSVRLSEGAEKLISAVHQAGGKVGAVSGGFIQILRPLAAQLGLDYSRANELEVTDGKLTGKVLGRIIDRQAKADALLEWAEDFGVSIDETMAIGDGANDIGMFEVAGISVAYHAKPAAREAASLVIDEPDLALVIPHL